MVTADAKEYTYHFNAIGSTIAITDASQSIVNSYSYAPFGKVLHETEAVPQPFKFVGQYGVMAEPNGLYYMRARYYDSATGRFISEDPIGFEGGTVNLYEYVGGNPVNWIDPWGLLRYNTDDTTITGRLTGETLTFAECLGKCAGFELTVTGGSETSGHSEGSKHYAGQACDFSDARNPRLNPRTVEQCYGECARDNYYGQKEGGTYPHWHFQTVPGRGNATGLRP